LSQELEDRYMVRRFRRLLRWRQYVGSVVKAAKEVLGPDTQVYVVGGAAEGRLTALSDIDFVLVTPNAPRSARDKIRLAILVRDRAVTRYGLPMDYPVDLHIYNPEEFLRAKKHYKAIIKVG